MTDRGKLALPFTASGRARMRANVRTDRDVRAQYPGLNVSTLFAWPVGFVLAPPSRGSITEIVLHLLFLSVLWLALERIFRAWLADAVHVRFGPLRTLVLLGGTVLAAGLAQMLRSPTWDDPMLAQSMGAGVLGAYFWLVVLLGAQYRAEGRATPAPAPTPEDAAALAGPSLRISGGLAAGFAVAAALLALWRAA